MAKKKSEKSSAGGHSGASAKKKSTAGKAKSAAGSSAKAASAKSGGSKPSGSQHKPTRAGRPAAAAMSANPMIDTSLAAQAAASMLLSRQKRENDQPEKKGSLVQQLKQDLINKGHQQTVSGVLDKTAGAGQKRPNLPFGQKQVGHNQTFGQDLTRSGVPRRTSG